MKLAFEAPFIRGRMLPALFSSMPFAKEPRFEGDPWATCPHSPMCFWMHSNECREAAKDTIYANALYRDRPVRREPFPADLDVLFAHMPASRADEPRATALQSLLFPEVVE